MRFRGFVCCFALFVSFILSGCGFVPTESKLAGTWQVEMAPPNRIVYAFQKDHTYTLTIGAQPGAIQGKWRLEGDVLTLTMGAFIANGMTNTLPVTKGLGTQKNVIVRLTDSSMTWRTGLLGGRLTFKRIGSPGQNPRSSPS
jgi:hypothetical protein